jgi:hypothetical protein
MPEAEAAGALTFDLDRLALPACRGRSWRSAVPFERWDWQHSHSAAFGLRWLRRTSRSAPPKNARRWLEPEQQREKYGNTEGPSRDMKRDVQEPRAAWSRRCEIRIKPELLGHLSGPPERDYSRGINSHMRVAQPSGKHGNDRRIWRKRHSPAGNSDGRTFSASPEDTVSHHHAKVCKLTGPQDQARTAA